MKRILTAALMAPTVTWVVFAGHPIMFWCVTCLVALICYHEFAGIADEHGYVAEHPIAYAAGLVLLLAPQPDAVLLVLVAIAALVISIRSGSLTVVLPQAAAIVFGVVYVFGAWRCAISLRQVSPHWVMYALVLNWVGDIGAYYVGRMVGKHKLAPRLSPGKTWEGSIASVIFSTAFGVMYLGYFLPATSLAEAVLLTIAANIAGQIGDLSESAMKRGAGLKDSGNLLPGHGGMLDRVDSTLFSLPLVYAWVLRATISG